MRIFTQKDLFGYARAFQTFMGACNGQQVRIKPHGEQVERALKAGITIDELLNFDNYRRVEEVKPNASLVDYVDLLIDRRIEVLSLTEDSDWDNPGTFPFYAEMFHNYYVETCGIGGTFSTPTAKENLRKAILRNSLQAIMNHKTIEQVMEATGQGKKLSCFRYIKEILDNRESYDIDNTLSEAQEARHAFTEILIPGRPQGEPVEHNPGTAEVITEGAPQPSDSSIHASDGFYDEIPPEGDEAFVAMPAPREVKRASIIEAINALPLSALTKFMALFDEDMSFDEFVNLLTDGEVDKSREMTDERNVHQLINGSLYLPFLNCARWQGIEISEETASKMDLLTTNWDLRDAKTRKLQKIKELIYNHTVNNSDDGDLMGVIADLEKYYSLE